jgi:hypothetical protein
VRVALDVVLSVTVITTVYGLPVFDVGVPVMTPVLELMLNPAGRPGADHVYGPVPPEVVTVVAG